MPHAIVTGAGSGVGQAVALALLQRGWTVSLFGRRAEALAATAASAGDRASNAGCYAVDVANEVQVAKAVADLAAKHRTIDALVNAAGTNIPRRGLSELSRSDWREVIDVNLNGTYFLVNEVLPAMRRQGAGAIVNIASEASLRASAKAGASYVASKFAVRGLTQAINAEEQKNGIRATAVFPGDIDTPLLDKRPQPPPADARRNMLQASDVAACVLLAMDLPSRAVVEELVIRPRSLSDRS
jgi:NADP-dependent 3-hydroxy acid dehydrogenase YdfG